MITPPPKHHPRPTFAHPVLLHQVRTNATNYNTICTPSICLSNTQHCPVAGPSARGHLKLICCWAGARCLSPDLLLRGQLAVWCFSDPQKVHGSTSLALPVKYFAFRSETISCYWWQLLACETDGHNGATCHPEIPSCILEDCRSRHRTLVWPLGISLPWPWHIR